MKVKIRFAAKKVDPRDNPKGRLVHPWPKEEQWQCPICKDTRWQASCCKTCNWPVEPVLLPVEYYDANISKIHHMKGRA